MWLINCVGSLWLPLESLWLPLGSLWAPLAVLWGTFGNPEVAVGFLWRALGCLGPPSKFDWKLDTQMCKIHVFYNLKLVFWSSHPDPDGPAGPGDPVEVVS